MKDGIYTLANDGVYDQLVALLNSIEENAGRDIPVCVIPYDDQLQRVSAEVAKRDNVTLLNDPDLFACWEDFSYEIWQAHPTALEVWKQQGIKTKFYRVGSNRRYCAFDLRAPFDRFIYLDADTLMMKPLDFMFQQLDTSDVAVYDFQYKDPSHIFNLKSSKLIEIFGEDRIASEIFCAGFYAARRGLLPPENRDWMISELQNGDAEVLYLGAPNQSVLNYMVMKAGLQVYNFALNLPRQALTGNSATSPHFKARDAVLYDKGSRLAYLHYIGISSKHFSQLCNGENVDFPYRDVFLHYRYLHNPESRPQLSGKPHFYKQPPSLQKRLLRKLKLAR